MGGVQKYFLHDVTKWIHKQKTNYLTTKVNDLEDNLPRILRVKMERENGRIHFIVSRVKRKKTHATQKIKTKHKRFEFEDTRHQTNSSDGTHKPSSFTHASRTLGT